MTARRVVIVQRRLTHYRVPLFDGLRTALALRDIRLDLLVGRGTLEENEKRDGGDLPWAVALPTRYFAGGKLCWQPFGREIAGSDLVIVTQENRLLYNHWLLVRPRRVKLAFWGHGANLQSNNPRSMRERFKRWTTRRVDWWFAYTQSSADLVAAAGFPRDRITVVNNAVDTSALRRWRSEVTGDETQALRRKLGFDDEPVGVFVGSLYADKRLDFLFAAAQAVRRAIPTFRLLVIGDGPERDKVRSWCEAHPWARWVGARHGREKVVYVSAAQVMLNPSLVGLTMLDSFALGLPMITTASVGHGPELAYLKPGSNGVTTENDVGAYASAVVTLLRDDGTLAQLGAACLACADQYTLDDMIHRFAAGIEAALRALPK